jgi:hypothetical protein
MARQGTAECEPQKITPPSTFNVTLQSRFAGSADHRSCTFDASQTKRCLDVANYPALSAFSKST